MFTLNCRGKLLAFDQPIVAGIINATPDSFFRGDLASGIAGIVELAAKMLAEGAAILDIGAQSTAPNAPEISEKEELARLMPALGAILEKHPDAVISVDTYRSHVAEQAVAAGAHIINDISGGLLDPEILDVVAGARAPFVCMHMKGTPRTMQQLTRYDNILAEMLQYFYARLDACRLAGIHDVVIDPGFGFAKTAEQNLYLLRNLESFKVLGKPLLAGISRKSTVYKNLGIAPADALNGTTVLNTLALTGGANILRVHDVKEAREAIILTQKYREANA